MNQRIQELVKEATRTTFNQDGAGFHHFSKEKFAELIVRECTEVINAGKVGYNQVPAEVALDMTAKTVKEYFGVK